MWVPHRSWAQAAVSLSGQGPLLLWALKATQRGRTGLQRGRTCGVLHLLKGAGNSLLIHVGGASGLGWAGNSGLCQVCDNLDRLSEAGVSWLACQLLTLLGVALAGGKAAECTWVH